MAAAVAVPPRAQRAPLGLAWAVLPLKLRLAVGGVAALALILVAGAIAALVLVLDQLG